MLFYHSQTKEAVGIAEVVKDAYPDPTQFEKKSKYFDEKSDKENPRWFLVDITLGSIFKREVTLKEIKSTAALSKTISTRGNSALSVAAASQVGLKLGPSIS